MKDMVMGGVYSKSSYDNNIVKVVRAMQNKWRRVTS
jgi:hypothetical protein